MAYSIAWNEAAPVGASVSASTLDTELQNLKKSVRERMNDILGNVWETDADNPKAIDYPLGVPLHWSLGMIDRGSTTTWIGSGSERVLSPTAAGAQYIMYIPVPMKTGITLASAKIRIYRDTGAAIVMEMKHVGASGAETTLDTATSASTGWHDLSVTGLAHTVLVDNVYLFRINVTADGASGTSARLLYAQVD